MNLFKVIPINAMINDGHAKAATARGMALQTVDWYMHGKPSMQEYDNMELHLKKLAAK